MAERPMTVLALASYFKGERFLEQAHRRGAKVYLFTQAHLLDRPWPRDALVDVFAQPDNSPLAHTLHAVAYLARSRVFDLVVALDDYDVETAAALREHLRLPGMGDTTARYFRDKLAMRTRARAAGISVPPFVRVLNYDELRDFMANIPPPWMLKPRSEASASGIVKVESTEQLWRTLDVLGDRQSYFLLEKYLPGDVYHVDSIVQERAVLFAEVHRCGTPPFDVARGGGIYTSHTVERGSPVDLGLRALNARVLGELGMVRGVSHVEFIRSPDGTLYMLETSARVGGAHTADMVEAATGLNLWEEWADLELDGAAYRLPQPRTDYAGLLMTLARQEHPDLSSYADPEVVLRAGEPFHAGLVVRSPDRERVEALLSDYARRLRQEHSATLPAADRPAH
ncbi:MAG: ATP-grasp domain-containing protein [Myxococcaceae bacterium]